MNQRNFENALKELQELADKIKLQDTSLEEAIQCYEQGMQYYGICSDILENAKQTIETFEGEV